MVKTAKLYELVFPTHINDLLLTALFSSRNLLSDSWVKELLVNDANAVQQFIDTIRINNLIPRSL